MKVAIILLTVIFLAVLSVSIADTHPRAAGHHHVVKHDTYHTDGHGDAKKGAKHASHQHVKKAGRKSHVDEEEAKKGSKEVIKHKIEDSEGGGKKSKSHSGDSHQSFKKSGAHSAHGAKFKTGAKQKKTNFSKGFREQYHKDEHKKHDTFYSNDHKTGEYRLFGAKNQKYHSHHHDKDEHGKFVSKKHSDKYGKDGKKSDGFKYSTHKGYQQENGNNKYYMKHDKWAKKNGKNHHGNVHESNAYLPLK